LEGSDASRQLSLGEELLSDTGLCTSLAMARKPNVGDVDSGEGGKGMGVQTHSRLKNASPVGWLKLTNEVDGEESTRFFGISCKFEPKEETLVLLCFDFCVQVNLWLTLRD